jgi:hypothetical protein
MTVRTFPTLFRKMRTHEIGAVIFNKAMAVDASNSKVAFSVYVSLIRPSLPIRILTILRK